MSSNYIVDAALEEMRARHHDPYANAKSAIDAASERGVKVDEVLMERFPPGAGGIGHANRQARREIKAQIREWLAPVQW